MRAPTGVSGRTWTRAGHARTGGVASATRTIDAHDRTLPAASVAVNVTRVSPHGYASDASAPPAVRSLATVVGPQSSVTVARTLTNVPPEGSAATAMVAGQRTEGGAASVTWTSVTHVAEFPDESVVVNVTLVV